MYVTAASIKKKLITILLVAMNVVIFIVINVYLNSVSGTYWLDNLAQYNYLILQFGEYYRLFTAMLIHSDIYHLLSNMIFLGIFGLLVENKYSALQYLTIYFVSGLLGNLISLFILPLDVFSLGASGCIFGILGAYYISFTAYDKRMIIYAVVSSLIMVALSISTNTNSWAHLLGAVGGLTLGWIFTAFNKRKMQRQSNKRFQPSTDYDSYDYSELDDNDEEIDEY